MRLCSVGRGRWRSLLRGRRRRRAGSARRVGVRERELVEVGGWGRGEVRKRGRNRGGWVEYDVMCSRVTLMLLKGIFE